MIGRQRAYRANALGLHAPQTGSLLSSLRRGEKGLRAKSHPFQDGCIRRSSRRASTQPGVTPVSDPISCQHIYQLTRCLRCLPNNPKTKSGTHRNPTELKRSRAHGKLRPSTKAANKLRAPTKDRSQAARLGSLRRSFFSIPRGWKLINVWTFSVLREAVMLRNVVD
jgi:hypothetical protein